MESQTFDHASGLPPDRYAPLDTDNGRCFVAYSPIGVSAVRPARDNAAFEAWFRGQLGRPLLRCALLPTDLVEAMHEQLHGRDYQVPLDLRTSSDFDRAVLLKTLDIP